MRTRIIGCALGQRVCNKAQSVHFFNNTCAVVKSWISDTLGNGHQSINLDLFFTMASYGIDDK